MPIVISDKGEQHRGKDCFHTESLQILSGLNLIRKLIRKDCRKLLSVEEGCPGHKHTDGAAYQHAVAHSLLCSALLSRPHILCDKGGHGLHQRSRNQHHNGGELIGYPVSTGGRQLNLRSASHPIDKCHQKQEGNLSQQLLKCNWKSQCNNLFHLRGETYL